MSGLETARCDFASTRDTQPAGQRSRTGVRTQMARLHPRGLAGPQSTLSGGAIGDQVRRSAIAASPLAIGDSASLMPYNSNTSRSISVSTAWIWRSIGVLAGGLLVSGNCLFNTSIFWTSAFSGQVFPGAAQAKVIGIRVDPVDRHIRHVLIDQAVIGTHLRVSHKGMLSLLAANQKSLLFNIQRR
jgi:hypothetical protein